MEEKRCPVFVNGKECGLPLTQIDREGKTTARFDLATLECSQGHRSHFLRELSTSPTEHMGKRINEPARNYGETHDPKLREELNRLSRDPGKMEKN
jgi:hypothetical protein